MQFLTFSEIKSKTTLKNQILKGQIKVYECNTNHDMTYRLIGKGDSLLNLWDGFRFPKKYSQDTDIAKGYLGISFQYKFSK